MGYLYNLIEVIKYLKNNHYCDELFENNSVYQKINDNTRLICELRNNVLYHGTIHGNESRGPTQIENGLNISRNDTLKIIWLTLRCGDFLISQILKKFKEIESKTDEMIEENMYTNKEILFVEAYDDAKAEFTNLIKIQKNNTLN